MKIVFFVRDLGLGGVERCVTLVAAGLAARGFDITIALLGGNRNLWSAQTDSVRVVDLSTVWHGKKPWTWLAGWRAARAGQGSRHSDRRDFPDAALHGLGRDARLGHQGKGNRRERFECKEGFERGTR